MHKIYISIVLGLIYFVLSAPDLSAQRMVHSIALDSSKNALQCYELALEKEENGEYLLAIKNYNYSLIIEEMADSTLMGKCYKNLCDLYWRNGNNPKALEAGIKAMEIFKAKDDLAFQVESSHKVVQIYISVGDFDRAQELRFEVQALAEKTENTLHIAENYRLEGVILFYKEEYLNSISLYKKALILHQQSKNNIEVSIDLGNIAESYERLAQVDSALNYYEKAISIQQKENFESGLIFTYYGMGMTFQKDENYSKATSYYKRSIALMKAISETREMPYVYGLMANLYAESAQYKLAFEYQEKKEKFNDSIALMEKQKRFEELKLEYHIENAWKENEFLRKENALKGEQLQNNNRIIRLQKVVLTFIILGLLLSIIYTIVFFNNQRRLKRANSTRDKLFSIIAHDLRGPIGSAKGLVEVLLNYDPMADSDKVNQYLLLLSDSLGTTYNLLEELLAWAKAQNEHFIFNPKNTDIKTIAENSINHLEHAWGEKEVEIENCLDTEPNVFVDKAMITTVVRNLLSNAIKFSYPQGKIELYGSIKGLFYEVCVRDYGVGIRENKLHEIFDPNSFYTTYGTKNEKGTGLGLLLCSEFVKKNGGSIHVESELGKGSTFIFTLPLGNI